MQLLVLWFLVFGPQVVDGLVLSFDLGHYGMVGPGVTPLLNVGDSVGGVFEYHLTPSIGKVAGPDRAIFILDHLATSSAEPDSLHNSRDQQFSPNYKEEKGHFQKVQSLEPPR